MRAAVCSTSDVRNVVSVVLGMVLASSGVGCSFLAPSDAELMGGGAHDAAGDAEGGAHDGAASDGSSDGSLDATPDAACLVLGEFCNGMPSRCCSGTCNGAAGRKCD